MKQAEKIYMISDAAKQVQVEAHVLRYWEEELEIPTKRNEMGHRYYTEEDIGTLRRVKELKAQGLQLKAIRQILKSGSLQMPMLLFENSEAGNGVQPYSTATVQADPTANRQSIQGMSLQAAPEMASTVQSASTQPVSGSALSGQMASIQGDMDMGKRHVVMVKKGEFLPMDGKTMQIQEESREQKSIRLQQLLKEMIVETVQTNNKEICQEIKETLLKELDYQFRLQEEKEDAWEEEWNTKQEEHYQRLDELIRSYNKQGKKRKRIREEKAVEKEGMKKEKIEKKGKARKATEREKNEREGERVETPQEEKADTDGYERNKGFMGFLRRKRSIV